MHVLPICLIKVNPMKKVNHHKEVRNMPVSVMILVLLVVFQALSGLAGGICLTVAPSGSIMQMPLNALAGSPFHNYLIPGLCLFILLGILPSVAAVGLIRKNTGSWQNLLNIYRKRHWAWAFSLYTGLMLIFWMDVETWVIGYGSLLQAVYGITGLLITIFSLVPGVMKYYKTSR